MSTSSIIGFCFILLTTPNRIGLGAMDMVGGWWRNLAECRVSLLFFSSLLNATSTDYHIDPSIGSMGRWVARGHWYRRGTQELGIAYSTCSRVQSPLEKFRLARVMFRGASVGNSQRRNKTIGRASVSKSRLRSRIMNITLIRLL